MYFADPLEHITIKGDKLLEGKSIYQVEYCDVGMLNWKLLSLQIWYGSKLIEIFPKKKVRNELYTIQLCVWEPFLYTLKSSVTLVTQSRAFASRKFQKLGAN